MLIRWFSYERVCAISLKDNPETFISKLNVLFSILSQRTCALESSEWSFLIEDDSYDYDDDDCTVISLIFNNNNDFAVKLIQQNE